MIYEIVQYVYLVYFFYISLFVGFIIGGISYTVSTKVIEYDLGSAYECGFEPFEESHRPFSVTFYLVGLLFVLFDIEIIFLLPWCVSSMDLLWNGWVFMSFFFQFLLLGFLFEWCRGAISMILR